MIKGCFTCKYRKIKCEGECLNCECAVPQDAITIAKRLQYGLTERECKCLVCYDEKSGTYKYYEAENEDNELIGFVKLCGGV